MNVVFLTLVDPSGTSGQNIYSRNVASALAGLDQVSLTFICPEPANDLPCAIKNACDTISTLPGKSSRSIRWHSRIQRTLYFQLREILQHGRIDVLISTLRPSLLVPPLVAWQYGTRYRILVEGMIGHGVDNLSSIPLDTLLSDVTSTLNLRVAERCFAVNSDVESWMRSLPFCNPSIDILPHGIDVPEILRPTDREGQNTGIQSEHEFSVCYVGSFKEYHCLPALVEGIAILREEGLDVGLSLVGTGPEYGSVQELTQKYGIRDATTFHGFVEPVRVPEYIRLADVCYGVIEPTRTGSPMKVYEYLANSAPVIATHCQEFGFVEEEDVGVLIKEPRAEAVARGIERICGVSGSDRTRMCERARKAGYENGHTWKKFAERLITE